MRGPELSVFLRQLMHKLPHIGQFLCLGLLVMVSAPALCESALPQDPGSSTQLEGASAFAQVDCAQTGPVQQGLATWYGGQRWHGRRTASGERFDRHGFTAAHPSAPLGSRVRVVNLLNGREVMVRINDRGPVGQRFIIDLSEAAAERLGMRRKGRAMVEVHHAFAHDDSPVQCP